MRAAPRALAGIIVLGGLIAIAVVLRDYAPPATRSLAEDGTGPRIEPAARDAAPAVQPTAVPAVAPDEAPPPAVASASPVDEEARMCAQTLEDAADFATLERNAANPTTSDENEEWLAAELAKLRRDATSTPDPELFLAAVLWNRPDRSSTDPSAYTTLIDLGARASRSDSPLLAWHALRACVAARELCPFAHLEQTLLETDQRNAEAWALVATLRHRRGDGAGALVAMQGAARASTSTWYWTETIASVERSLAAATAIPYPSRPTTAIGVAAANLPDQTITTICRQESARSRAWAEACLAFGTLRTERNETTMARGIAFGIREQALTALGDSEGAKEVAAERALYEAQRSSGGPVLEPLLTTNPTRLEAYLAVVRQAGESAGVREFLRQEVPPLLERAGLLERDGVRECVARSFAPRTAVGTRAATADYRVKDADELLVSVRGGVALSTTAQVQPDGTITLRLPAVAGRANRASERERPVFAVGKTTRELERDIVTIFSERVQSPQVVVILLTARSREDLEREFDTALQESRQPPAVRGEEPL